MPEVQGFPKSLPVASKTVLIPTLDRWEPGEGGGGVGGVCDCPAALFPHTRVTSHKLRVLNATFRVKTYTGVEFVGKTIKSLDRICIDTCGGLPGPPFTAHGWGLVIGRPREPPVVLVSITASGSGMRCSMDP